MKKLLIWDGDDSLWNGTLLAGDQVTITPERIELVKKLRDRGVLQSIASHNLLGNVMDVIHKYGIQDCFLSIQANQPVPKSFMIKVIMEELNIARQEDVVFVDDQPFNLNETANSFPHVTCIFPHEVPGAVANFFTKDSYTDEDRNRVLRYRSEESRKRASVEYNGSYLDFLRTCDMQADVRMPEIKEMDRVTDLILRANRLSIMSADVPNTELWAKRYLIRGCWSKDKFGDNGLIGVLFAENRVISIFVVSCTMQNKGIGSYLLGSFLNEHVGERVSIGWNPTEYNQSMLQLLNYFSFNRDESIDSVLRDGIQLYRIKNVTKVELPDWIKPYEKENV